MLASCKSSASMLVFKKFPIRRTSIHSRQVQARGGDLFSVFRFPSSLSHFLPRLLYRPIKPKVVSLISVSGKIVQTGAKVCGLFFSPPISSTSASRVSAMVGGCHLLRFLDSSGSVLKRHLMFFVFLSIQYGINCSLRIPQALTLDSRFRCPSSA